VGSIGTTRKGAEIANDTLSTRGYQALIGGMLDLVVSPVAYMFTDWRMWVPLFDVAESHGRGVRSMIVWGKPSPGMGRGWLSQHELVMAAVAARNTWANPKLSSGNVLESELWGPDGAAFLRAGRTRNKHHFTEKPVDVLEQLLRPVEDWCRVVYDPFAGSGSTLIAASRKDMRTRLVELSPGWCDVIRDRWTRWAEEAQVEPGPGAMRLPDPEEA